ncbi:uncharacterized protein FA14DRAFT_160573 [Meira miltonrushii]|uniref:Tr-type G domain-containing protein n=1 Tax=Meira miltonrushii TaxID=1280837 RepID=A0A316VGH1_9BASI|nr:uncharacterized protein FA14DRAFT_160573 [Meira miltonrushii]PWN35423.1 hypothetical protein FA14DRAFT_160573 [Meira miltonrushii]
MSDESGEFRRGNNINARSAKFTKKGKQAKPGRRAEEEEDDDDDDDLLASKKMKGRRGKPGKGPQAVPPPGKGSRDKGVQFSSSFKSALKVRDKPKKDNNQEPAKAATPRKPSPTPTRRPFRPQKVSIPLPQFITVNNLAKVLDTKMFRLQRVMTQAGHTDTRPDLMLSHSEAELLAMEFNVTVTPLSTSSNDYDIFPRPPPSDPQSLPLRPPVVAIMGHVDHGKTTLLDKLRSASVAAGEAGGITQHVGAFSVEVAGMSNESEKRAITFLDTPGHAAFTQMRSRGAKVTDIVVLVVAADDGVMPQTKEVINMVREVQEEEGVKGAGTGGLQLLIAISKVDRPDADPAKVKGQILGENVILEEFGGDVPCIEISGKTGQGLDVLQDNLVVISELNELRAERTGPVEGYVIESRVEKGFGNTAICLVQRGTLKVGDVCVAGTSWCKVRRLMDSSASLDVAAAEPGQALLLTGWRELPKAGDMLLGVESSGGQDAEELVKKCIDTRLRVEEQRKLLRDVEAINEGRREEANERDKSDRQATEVRRLQREARLAGEEYDLSDLQARVEAAEKKNASATVTQSGKLELRLIVKADVSGTVEAVTGAIEGIGNNEVGVKIIHSGVGEPTESDLDMAKAANGHILGFNVEASRSLHSSAQALIPAIKIHCDDVIYRLMSYVTDECIALLPPVYESRVVGEATIQQVFAINVRGRTTKNIAGCRITNGTVSRNQKIRVLRNVGEGKKANEGEIKLDSAGRQILYEGRLDSLKQVKKEVDEMRKGTECGMSFADGFENFQAGDLIQCYYDEKVTRTL